MKSGIELIDLCKKYNTNNEIVKLNDIIKVKPKLSRLIVDVPIEAIADKNLLSKRAVKICKAAGLISINMIIEHYKDNLSFFNLLYCTKKSSVELIKFCKKYGTNPFHTIEIEKSMGPIQFLNTGVDISIEQLNKMNLLSKLSNTICKTAGIMNLKDLILYYQENGTFKKIFNCGLISNAELTDLCDKFIHHREVIFKVTTPKVNKDILNPHLDMDLDEIFSRYLLSRRAINVCRRSGLLSLNLILDFYQSGKSFLNFNKCGKMMENELVEFCEKIIKLRGIIRMSNF